MNKKIIFAVIFSILFFSFSYSQEFSEEETHEEKTETSEKIHFGEKARSAQNENISLLGNKYTKPVNLVDFINQFDFVFQMTPSIYVNTESKLVSAPSPIFFPVSVGLIWPNFTFLSVQPSLSYFSINYLWHDGKALPAEIENRTATAYSLFLNIPAVVTLFIQNGRFQFSLGAGFLFRIIALASGVAPQDFGETGSAQSDTDLIGSYLWQPENFIYITTEFSWLFDVAKTFKVGPIVGAYVPVSIFQSDFSKFIGYLGVKVSL